MSRFGATAILRIAGGGPELLRLQRLARQLALGERVEFLGHVPLARLAAEYRRADLFCLPSRQEGLGIVFLEAMAAGPPIVAAPATAGAALPGGCETPAPRPPRAAAPLAAA